MVIRCFLLNCCLDGNSGGDKSSSDVTPLILLLLLWPVSFLLRLCDNLERSKLCEKVLFYFNLCYFYFIHDLTPTLFLLLHTCKQTSPITDWLVKLINLEGEKTNGMIFGSEEKKRIF